MGRLENIFSGAATGAQIGSAGGGWGMAVGGVLGGLYGAGQETAEQSQYNQQNQLNSLSYKYNMKLMNEQQKAAYQMWLKTNYSAQMEQMKKAGLNPALMYGMSGGGGASMGNPQTGSFQSQAGSNVGVDQLNIQRTGQVLQNALLNSQRENIS